MREFFHGWRRKVGVVTLVMACGFAGAWIRSYALFDIVYIGAARNSHVLVSASGKLCWVTFDNGLDWYEWYTFSRFDDDGGFEAAEAAYFGARGQFESQRLVFYWIPTLPLTLVSAYLLLWKPRKAKPSDLLANLNVHSN